MSKKKDVEEFTVRVLMSMLVDVQQLIESAERTRIQVFTLAKEHGITIPAA